MFRAWHLPLLLAVLGWVACSSADHTPSPDECQYATPYYPDVDGDGFGDDAATPACKDGEGMVSNAKDCDDADPEIFPRQTEICDGIDNNCDGAKESPTRWFVDGDGDGYGVKDSAFYSCWPQIWASPLSGDCNDDNPFVNPAAKESCTPGDDDCDGAFDEESSGYNFYDADGDGFGGAPLYSCFGGVTLRGDCDDGDPNVHPGAEDVLGDDKDQDCGGFDGPDIHVGLGPSSKTELWRALSSARIGQVLWVGPGIYPGVDLSFLGKAFTLRSVGGPKQTVIDASGAGRVFVFTGGEEEDSVLDGFTLMGGIAPDEEGGGGIYISHAKPTFKDLIIRNNYAHFGGGLSAINGGPSFENCEIIDNEALTDGGGVYFLDSTFDLTEGNIGNNYAGAYGGGIAAFRSEGNFSGHRLMANLSDLGGGGAWFDNSGGDFYGSVISGNKTFGEVGGLRLFLSNSIFGDPTFIGNLSLGGPVGGLSLRTANVTIYEGRFVGNVAGVDGGGLRIEDTTLSLEGTYFGENRAVQGGGGMSLYRGYAVAKQLLFEDNSAIGGDDSNGGGVLVNDAGLDLEYAAFEGNLALGYKSEGGGLYIVKSSPSLFHTSFYGNGASYRGGGLSLTNSSPYLYFSTVVNNWASAGGGLSMYGASSPQGNTSLIAYNWPQNLYSCCYEDGQEGPALYFLFSNFYNPYGAEDINPPWMDASNPLIEPGFLAYDEEGVPTDVHLALDSPLIDLGDPSFTDPDGSVANPGMFGGVGADLYDLDRDGAAAYFWPGNIEDAPEGFTASEYDCNDRNPDSQECN